MRDTVWAGHPQKMVNDDGSAKGLRTILCERGINTQTMKADKLQTPHCLALVLLYPPSQ